VAKNTILMIGDGMGWEVARAAAIQAQINAGNKGNKLSDFYTSGQGSGLNLQKLTGYGLATTYGTTIAGTSGTYNVSNSALNEPSVLIPGATAGTTVPGTTLTVPTGTAPLLPGFSFDPTFNAGISASGGAKVADGVKGNLVGYDPVKGGATPWTAGTDKEYIKYSYPDSANTATTLYTGVKSYNAAIGVDIFEQPLDGILAQAARLGKATGLVTSVPIDHATPAAAAANVSNRNKYDTAFPALDNILQQELRIYQPNVLLGGGHPLSNSPTLLPVGVEPIRDNTYIKPETYTELSTKPNATGTNSNIYGYTFLERGKDAATVLAEIAKTIDPDKDGHLLGLYGARGQDGNLPVSSANGDYSTTGLGMFSINSSKGLKQDFVRPLLPGETDASFIARERNENPTLNDLTKAALEVLGKDKDGMWLMIEGGDIDWAEHDNSIDNAIGTMFDFDKAVGSVLDWISKNGGWEQNELIITADHDHYLTLNDNFPELLRTKGAEALTAVDTSAEAGHYWGSKPTEVTIPDPKDPTKTIVDPESGKYGWGNHSNRPVPVYYQGADTELLKTDIGKGYVNYGTAVPGIPGLIDQTTIYRAQAAGVNKLATDVGILTTYNWDDRPVVGITSTFNPKATTTTVPGQEIKLGGFSGLKYEGMAANGNLKFITHTDRGPNAENVDLIKDVAGNEKPFLLPNFQPEIDRFELNAATGKITLTQRIKLTAPNGKALTGLPNLQSGEQGKAYTDEVPIDLFGNRLPNDPLGADLEGIAIASDGTFWMADEYRPSVYHFDANGKLIERLIPKGDPTKDGTFGTPILPEVYAQRRANRGFEGIAVDGTKVYAFMQSGLDNPDVANDANSKASGNLRIVEYDTVTKAVTGEYLYQLTDVKIADKLGDATALGNGKFLIAERDSIATVDSIKSIYEIDISKATNISVAANVAGVPAGKTIDRLTTAELAAAKINTATKKFIANASTLGYTGVEKLEGLTVVDNNTLAIINDNDFGVGLTPITGNGKVELNENAPVKLGLIELNKPIYAETIANGVTKAPAYAIDLPGEPQFDLKPLLTVGDEIPLLVGKGLDLQLSDRKFALAGIPDGLGYTKVGDKYFVFMNHELANTAFSNLNNTDPAQIKGSRVSLLVFDRDWKIIGGKNLIEKVTDSTGTYTLNTTSGKYEKDATNSFSFGRFCSAYLADQGFVGADGKTTPIFFTAEETDNKSRGWAVGIDGVATALDGLGRFAKENVLAASQYRATNSTKTVLLTTEDNTDGELYMFVGEQTKDDPNGFKNGDLYALKVKDVDTEGQLTLNKAVAASWVKVPKDRLFNADGTPKADGTDLATFANLKGNSTNFRRLEDIAEDPNKPGTFYFNVTGTKDKPQTDTTKPTATDAQATVAADAEDPYGRMYRFSLNANDPTGAIDNFELLVKGGPDIGVSFDNIVVDRNGKVLLMEDETAFGGEQMTAEKRDGRVHAYDIATKKITPLWETNETLGGTIPDKGPGFWETSGIIEINPNSLPGKSSYLFDVQAHSIPSSKYVEGGQLMLAVPKGGSPAGAENLVLPVEKWQFDNNNHLDLREQKEKVGFNCKTSHSSTYNNFVGFYRIDDASGKIGDLKPGDAGYIEAALKQSLLNMNKQADKDVSMAGGALYAPYLIANGTLEDFLAKNPKNQGDTNAVHAYFSFAGANPDKIDHLKALGDGKFGWEDTLGGGDRDFNDAILQIGKIG
jgi:alkaline phosphatase